MPTDPLTAPPIDGLSVYVDDYLPDAASPFPIAPGAVLLSRAHYDAVQAAIAYAGPGETWHLTALHVEREAPPDAETITIDLRGPDDA